MSETQREYTRVGSGRDSAGREVEWDRNRTAGWVVVRRRRVPGGPWRYGEVMLSLDGSQVFSGPVTIDFGTHYAPATPDGIHYVVQRWSRREPTQQESEGEP